MTTGEAKHVISVLTANESGVLSRITGLFSARGYNIESLTVAPTNNPSLSRVTIVTVGGDKLAEQIIKQLHKLIDIVAAVDLGMGEYVDREMILVKIECSDDCYTELEAFAAEYSAEVVERDAGLTILSMSTSVERIDQFIAALDDKWTIREIARSGIISLAKGDVVLGS